MQLFTSIGSILMNNLKIVYFVKIVHNIDVVRFDVVRFYELFTGGDGMRRLAGGLFRCQKLLNKCFFLFFYIFFVVSNL